MKFCIIFIIGFTQFVSCCDLNITGVSQADCPFKLFRRKRANEYTRWHADTETTSEFVVKVLDDDVTTKNKIIAVNIQPITKGIEKIIIGGAMVPKPTPSTADLESNEYYTRFVPPTTVATLSNGELYLAPASGLLTDFAVVEKLKPMMPRGRHPQRDESPPAGPQFLPKITQAVRQYAPITSVGFTRRRTTYAPLTPPTLMTFNPITLTIPRTSIGEVMVPTRTTSSLVEFRKFLYHTKEKDIDDFLRRTTTETTEILPSRTTEDITTNESIDIDSKAGGKDDSSYNVLFNYDEIDKTNKKLAKSDGNLEEIYDDINRDLDTNDIHDKEIVGIILEETTKTVLTTTELYDDMNYNDISTTTLNSSTTQNEIIPTKTEAVTRGVLNDSPRDKRRPFCSMLKLRQLSFNSPRTLPEIVAQMNLWADESPVAKWVDITNGNLTTMENPIYMMIVDDPSSGQIISAKQTIMIVAGIQGRDHHAVAAAMYVLYQLIERSGAHADLLSKYRFWVIPVFNPDGYDYSMTFPHRREWTKNLRQNWDICKGKESSKSCETYGIRCTIQPCYGVNLDRNFEYQWIPADELRTEHPCGSLYAGARQLSEPETRALTNFLHLQGRPLYTFIAFKEGDVLGVMYPYSHTRKRRAYDLIYRQRASRAAAAAYSISGRPYVAGQTSEFLPLHAGGIEDWIDGHLGIDNTYTIMMFRPSDAYNKNFVTERIVHEAYAAMDTLVLQSVEPLAASPVILTKTADSAASWSKSTPMILILIISIPCFT